MWRGFRSNHARGKISAQAGANCRLIRVIRVIRGSNFGVRLEPSRLHTFPMRIRPFTDADLPALVSLFTETVHRINARDYDPAQLSVWAPRAHDWAGWRKRFAGLRTWVAELDGPIVGFASYDEKGYVDFLYVHHEFQGRGVATALMEEVESQLRGLGLSRAYADVSFTAKTFFAGRGYVVLRQQWFEKSGVTLTNFAREKMLARETIKS